MRASHKKSKRQIPIASAILAFLLCASIIFGGIAIIVARVTATSDDIGLHIDGRWEIESPTHNNERITYAFAGDSFSMVTESMIFDADAEIIEDIQAYHMLYYGAEVDADYMGDGTFRLRIFADGTFVINGDIILMVTGEGLSRTLPFYWMDDAILINGYRFVRG
ncbi:MAG: hypothetical protein FWC92_02700 [Defluviitaleaceae bacterium]|nr:hypothetical protein [Defluviitaleaceae bacterium]